MRCDLCGEATVTWLWTTPNVITREQADAGEGWWFEDEGWYVCDLCHEFILAGNQDGLLMRAVINMEPTMEGVFEHPDLQAAIRDMRRAEMARAHSAFWNHKTTYERIED